MQHPPTGKQKKKRIPIQNAQFHLHGVRPRLKLLAWSNACFIENFMPFDIIALIF
jgi:lysine/ornithine N-monooxygenase